MKESKVRILSRIEARQRRVYLVLSASYGGSAPGEYGSDQTHHRAVLAEHHAGEGLDTPAPGRCGEPGEKELPDPATLPLILDDDTDVGTAAVLRPCVHRVADYLISCHRDEVFSLRFM